MYKKFINLFLIISSFVGVYICAYPYKNFQKNIYVYDYANCDVGENCVSSKSTKNCVNDKISGATNIEFSQYNIEAMPYKKVSAINAVDYYEFILNFEGKTYSLKFPYKKNTSKNFMIEKENHKWGRDGNHSEALFALNTLIDMGIKPSTAFEFLFPNINKKVDTILDKINIMPKDSQIYFTPNFSNKFFITQEKRGYIVDKENLFLQILEKFSKTPQLSIALQSKLVEPKFTKEENLQNTQLLSKFSTSIASSSSDRQNNVRLALKQFNGLEIKAGQEISFNSITGRRTEKKGYKPAHIILDGLFVDGVGGGVCQASTTLYNALILADNVEILEANRHSMPVGYVKLGFDAMVAFGSSDLRFRNCGDKSIYIRTYFQNGNVFVELYGKPISKFDKKRRCEVIKSIKSQGDIIKNDNGEFENLMDENGMYRQKANKDGMEVQTFLDYYDNGELIKSEKIRHTTYPAQRGIVYKGKKKLPEDFVETVPNECGTIFNNINNYELNN